MPKLPQVSGKEVIKAFMVPNHREIALGTLGSILKQANVTKKEIDEV